jgi:hypothetical protein
MVTRRHVYHVAGYDPIDAGAQYRRFTRQLEVFRRTWNVDATSSGLEQPAAESRAWWTVKARAGDWQVEAVHEVLLWDDIVRGDFKRALPARLLDAARVYLDYIATGTMFRYIAANPRYAIFFLFPVLALVLFAAAGWIVARLLTAWIGLAGAGAVAVGLIAGIAVFYVLLQWPGRRWRVEQLLDDWICAHDYLHGRRADIDARLDRFAETLLAQVRAAEVDEIVLVGHSLGAMLVLDILVRALARHHTEIRAASRGTGDAPQNRAHRGGALDRLGRIPGARRHHQLLQVRSRRAAAHPRRPARRQAGDPARADSRHGAAGNLCPLPPQRPAAALSLGHGQRPARCLRLFHDGVRPGAVLGLDHLPGGLCRFH